MQQQMQGGGMPGGMPGGENPQQEAKPEEMVDPTIVENDKVFKNALRTVIGEATEPTQEESDGKTDESDDAQESNPQQEEKQQEEEGNPHDGQS